MSLAAAEGGSVFFAFVFYHVFGRDLCTRAIENGSISRVPSIENESITRGDCGICEGSQRKK